jgi:cobalt/nickel transport system permease protein
MRALPAIFALLVGAIGWYYLFFSKAASRLGSVEEQRTNRLRGLLRRINAILMLLIAVERAGSRDAPSWEADLPPALAALAFALILATLARIPLGVMLWKLRGAAVLLAAVLVVFPLSYGGDRIQFGPVGLSWDGLLAAVLVITRALSLIIVAFVAFATTPFHAAMKALRRLRVPAPLVQTILFTYRYIIVYADQLRRRETALRARGFRPRADLRTLRTIGNGFGSLLVGSIERTQRIQAAMRCRGFSGTFRTLEEPRAGPGDVFLSAAVLAVGAGLLLWTVL